MTPHRLPFPALLLLLAPALVTLLGVTPHPATAADGPPNIVVIVTDDQRWDTLQYMPIVSQRLAASGLVYDNAFVTTPLCCPARISFLTGLYAHHHGVLSNRGPVGGFPAFQGHDTSTLPVWLQAAGYRTSLVGKYMNEYPAVSRYIPPGWTDWHAYAGGYFNYNLNENGRVRNYGSAPENYSTDVLRDRATAFVKRNAKPFFLWFAPFAPHSPQTPAPRHAGLCDGLTFPRPPSFNEADVTDKPAWLQATPLMSEATIAALDKANRDRACSLLAVDEAVGAILDSLGSRLNNTIVVFTSDNGLAWGEHRLRGKNCVYEECIRVPLVIWSPRFIAQPGHRSQPALNIDLAPTLMQLAGATIPSAVDGVSLVPTLNDPNAIVRLDFLVEHEVDLDDPSAGMVTAVRGARWKYVELPSGERELYDLARDPYELTNVIGQPKTDTTVAQLAARLAELRGPP